MGGSCALPGLERRIPGFDDLPSHFLGLCDLRSEHCPNHQIMENDTLLSLSNLSI